MRIKSSVIPREGVERSRGRPERQPLCERDPEGEGVESEVTGSFSARFRTSE